MRERASDYQDNPELIKNLLAEGAEKARESARHTLDDVRRSMHLRRFRSPSHLRLGCPGVPAGVSAPARHVRDTSWRGRGARSARASCP